MIYELKSFSPQLLKENLIFLTKLPHVYLPPPGKADAHWAFWSDTALDPKMKRPMIALSLEMEVFLFFSFLSFWVFFFYTHFDSI